MNEEEKSALEREDLDLISDSKAAILNERTPFATAILWILSAFLLIGFLWSYCSVMEESTTAEGTVIAPSKIKTIQTLDGGVLSELYVSEGQYVEKGEKLLKLDDTRSGSTYEERHQKYYALLAAVERLKAEKNGLDEIVFSPELLAQKNVIQQQQFIFNSRKKSLEDSLKFLRRAKDYAWQELSMSEPLVKKGLVSELELLRIRRQFNEANNNIDERINKSKEGVSEELSKSESELDMLKKGILLDKDRWQKSTVYSPVSGEIKKLNIATIGGVIQPGSEIMEIVPKEDYLIVEAHVKPKDIGFIKVGQKAKVKLSAYDFSIYGGLDGVVIQISPDTLLSEDKKEIFYKIRVKTDKNHLGPDSNSLNLKVGMQTTVDIITGKKSVLSYVLKPLIKAKQNAMSER